MNVLNRGMHTCTEIHPEGIYACTELHLEGFTCAPKFFLGVCVYGVGSGVFNHNSESLFEPHSIQASQECYAKRHTLHA